MHIYISSYGLKNVRRPSLYIDESCEGTKKIFWSSVTFEATLDPFEVCVNSYEKVSLEISDFEVWEFFNVRISLLSESRDQFVMIFERCQRVNVSIGNS